MTALLPYPLLAVALALMWLALGGFTPGQIVLAIIVSVGSTHALRRLGEASPSIRRWLAIPDLLGIVFRDIIRSNIAVAGILLSGPHRPRNSGFVAIPLTMRSPAGLAFLAIIVTSTPGTAWIDFNTTRGELLIHVFDLIDDAEWVELITSRYERLLMEIFE